MKLESRDERKKKSFKRFVNSFKYSIEGLSYTIKNEQSIIIMVMFLILAITCGFILNINPIEWVFIFLTISMVLATELINTSIEATIDLLSPKFHPLAKIAKDTSSAAVFVSSIISIVIGGIIFIPKVLAILEIIKIG